MTLYNENQVQNVTLSKAHQYPCVSCCVYRYDRKAQLRPVFNITIGEYSVGALTVSHNGNEVIVGDVAGDVTSYDLRTGKAVAKFKVKIHLDTDTNTYTYIHA